MTGKPVDVICDGDVCRRVTPEEAAAAASVTVESAASELDTVKALLGDTLHGKDGKEVATASVLGAGKIIALYFSAHWCPPCRGFTPHLASIYKRFKELHAQKDNFEIIFVSSDRDEASFKGYCDEMPWLALPFSRRDEKMKLGQRYKVRGIPSLIVLDGATGELITANGRDAIGDDEQCENFPWRPQPISKIMAGPLVDKSGAEVDAEAALAGKVTMVYFSAHWCPPCRGFTPVLVDAYNKLKAAGKAVECVFVSGDKDDKQFNEYLDEMPWLAVPRSDAKRIAALNQVFEVDGIPSLIILDEQMQVINAQARSAVQADPELAKFPWRPLPVEQLTGATIASINDQPVAILALPAGPSTDALQARAEALLMAAATSAAGKEVRFLWGAYGDDLLGRVLEFVKEETEEESPKEKLLLVNVPNQEAYQTDLVGAAVTSDAVAGLIAQYKAGKLRARALGEEDE